MTAGVNKNPLFEGGRKEERKKTPRDPHECREGITIRQSVTLFDSAKRGGKGF